MGAIWRATRGVSRDEALDLGANDGFGAEVVFGARREGFRARQPSVIDAMVGKFHRLAGKRWTRGVEEGEGLRAYGIKKISVKAHNSSCDVLQVAPCRRGGSSLSLLYSLSST